MIEIFIKTNVKSGKIVLNKTLRQIQISFPRIKNLYRITRSISRYVGNGKNIFYLFLKGSCVCDREEQKIVTSISLRKKYTENWMY